MVTRLEIHAIDPLQDRTADDQAEADDPNVEQHGLDDIVGERADDRSRQERDQHAEDETSRRGIAEHAGGDLPDTEKIDRQQRKDRAELNQHGERLAEIVIVEAEEMLDQEEVPSR